MGKGKGGSGTAVNNIKNNSTINNIIDTKSITKAINNSTNVFSAVSKQSTDAFSAISRQSTDAFSAISRQSTEATNSLNNTLTALVSSQRQGDSAKTARIDQGLKVASIVSGFTLAYMVTPKNKGKK